MNQTGDPIGKAIADYVSSGKKKLIEVESDICDPDIIPVEYLFRSYEDMPKLEKKALERCKGKILDVGAAAGAHAFILKEKGFEITAIDTSKQAIDYLNSKGLKALHRDFFDEPFDSFDTLLLMMNGIGIAGTLANLEKTLTHAAKYLNPGGILLCDSTDIKYLYEDEEGGLWMDLNSEYYGNFRFQMSFEDEKGPWFDWLYVDFENLKKVAGKSGFTAEIVDLDESSYLAELKLI